MGCGGSILTRILSGSTEIGVESALVDLEGGSVGRNPSLCEKILLKYGKNNTEK
jgi:hypothetical protein